MKINFDAIKSKILAICFRKTTPKLDLKSHRMWMRKGLTVFLGSEDVRHFNDIIRMLFKDDVILNNFSRKDLEKAVKETITEVLKVPDENKPLKADNEVKNLEQKLKSQIQEWSFIIPLVNFCTEQKIVNVGNVKLYKFNSNREKRWLSELRAILRYNKNYTYEQKEEVIETEKKQVTFKLRDYFVAEIKVSGTKEGAKEVALRKIRTALSVLKLYSYSANGSYRRYFGVHGEVIPHTVRAILRAPTSKQSQNPILERVGFLYPYELDKNRLNFMRKAGFGKLSRLLKKSEINDLDKRLLTSIYWYAEAFDVPEDKSDEERVYYIRKQKDIFRKDLENFNFSDRFLKLVVALESLLIFGREPKGVNLAERSAFLLSDDYSKRLKIKEYMKKIYDLRSRIVHEGNLVISRNETNQLMNFVQSVILTLVIRRERLGLHSVNDLKIWFEKQKMS